MHTQKECLMTCYWISACIVLIGYWNWFFVLPTKTDGNWRFKKKSNETSLGKKLLKENSKLDNEHTAGNIWMSKTKAKLWDKAVHLSQCTASSLLRSGGWEVPAPHLTIISLSALPLRHLLPGENVWLLPYPGSTHPKQSELSRWGQCMWADRETLGSMI